MAKDKQYRFSKGENIYVLFDSKGNVLEAKGFGLLLQSTSQNVDKELIGKNVEELAEMLRKNGSYFNAYQEFEARVHLGLLKDMLAQN